MDTKVIVINSDKIFLESLRYSLEQDGYDIDEAYNIQEAISKIREKEYDLVLLDIVLPDGNGLTLCQTIRKYSQVPIIVLTGQKEDMSKVLALNYGADDYLTRPFNILELKARMNAILRRVNMVRPQVDSQVVKLDDFTINTLGRRVTIGDDNIDLTGKEFDLFYTLISNPGKVFTREELLEAIWGYEYFGDLRTVDVHIRRLREKIEDDPKNSEYILTKWGKGYYFRDKKSTAVIE